MPVRRDLKDLEEKVAWLKKNDEKAKKISEQGTLFVKNYLKEHHTREWTLRNMKLFEKAYHEPSIKASKYEDWL